MGQVRSGLLRRTAQSALAVGVVLACGASPARAQSTPLSGGATPGTAPCAQPQPWCERGLTPDARAGRLVGALTQDEKIDLLTAKPVPRLSVPASTPADGPVGLRTSGNLTPATALPSGTALAANFDPAAARRYGELIGRQARVFGFNWVFGPAGDIMRVPTGGRTFESFGEDPFLQSESTVGWIRGLQSQGVLAGMKHFILNNQEGQGGTSPANGAQGGRFSVNVHADDRTFNEIYLPPFEAAVKRGDVAGVMCSYNQVDGEYGCSNRRTLTTVLREQLGFQGTVMSDAVAAKTPKSDLNAGQNWDIVGNSLNPPLVNAALASGDVSQATLDARVREYLRTLFAHGLFDRPADTADTSKIDRAAGEQVATATAEGGLTLLKNDGVLPLASGRRTIAVIGRPAEKYVFGFGSPQVAPFEPVTLLAGLRARAARAGDSVVYDDGSDVARARSVARTADVVIVAAADSEAEGADKLCMSLRSDCAPSTTDNLGYADGGPAPDPTATQAAYGDQDALITAVSEENKRTVVVLQTGAPVLTPWRDRIAGLVEAWYPGEDGGTAIASVLYGDAEPGGRLPVTFPRSEDQQPTAGDQASYPGIVKPSVQQDAALGTLFDVTYKEGVLVGYRWFDEKGKEPAYPFGFGLGYTTFGFSDLRLEPAGDAVRASATVRNTGSRAGTAVPQLYVGMPDPSRGVVQPPFQLKGFEKVRLAPGDSRRVTFTLDDRAFSYWAGKGFAVAPGCYRIGVGAHSRDLPLQAVVGRGRDCGGALELPAGARACISRRAFTIRLPRRARTARVTVGGKRVRVVRRRGRLTARVDLRRFPKRRVTVKVAGRAKGGKSVRQTRVYRTCARRGRGR